MYYCHGKLKLTIAIAGIALALLPCLQQAHLLCQLAGCGGRNSGSAERYQNACAGHDDHCCESESQAPCGIPEQDREPDTNPPCEPECYFAQPVDPREAPREATSSFTAELTQEGVGSIVSLNATLDFHPTVTAWSAGKDCPFITAATTCAQLCRYLI